MVNVIVNRRKKVSVTANTMTGVDMAVTLKNTNKFNLADIRLDTLRDVYAPLNPLDGSTLVYNTANNTYVVQKLSIENVANVDILAIDGGSF